MAAVTETAPFSGQNVLTNTVHNAAKGTSSGLVKAAQSGAFARPQLTSNKASNRRSLKLIVLKRGRPTNAEKAQKAAQRTAETSEITAAAALQQLSNSTMLSPSGEAEQNLNNDAKTFEKDGCNQLPPPTENETDDLLEARNIEVLFLAEKLVVLESARKKSFSLELKRDEKEKERLQQKIEELDQKYQKEKAELDKIVKEKEDLKKEFKTFDARANKRKADDKHTDSEFNKIRITAASARLLLSNLERQLQERCQCI